MAGLTRRVRVALSARVSTRDKDQDPELHLQPMREYAHSRGWAVAEYVDHASAADLAGRTGWARRLEDVRRRRLDHVLAWKLDRPFRSTLHCLRTLEDLEHRGVGFACLTQDIDTTSPTGRLLVIILAAVAEFERGLIAERVREGMTNARRKGVRLGRPPAAERPHVVRWWSTVRAQRAAGTLSKRAAARHLTVGLATLERLLAAAPLVAATAPAPTAPETGRSVPKREAAAAGVVPASRHDPPSCSETISFRSATRPRRRWRPDHAAAATAPVLVG